MVFSSPISSCCMLAPTTLNSSSMSLIFFSAPSAIVLPLDASDSMVASFLEMSSNLFSESERVAFDSDNCLSRLSMASSFEETPFSNSILFLTLWSALKQAPASSRVAWN